MSEELKSLARKMRDALDDPMWADHVELSKGALKTWLAYLEHAIAQPTEEVQPVKPVSWRYRFKRRGSGNWSAWLTTNSDARPTGDKFHEVEIRPLIYGDAAVVERAQPAKWEGRFADGPWVSLSESDAALMRERTGWEIRELYTRPPAADKIEALAQAVYEQWKDMPGYKPWQAGGNSDKHEETRAIVRAALAGKDAP